MSISQKPLRSELGFSSPGFIVDTYGNINITGDFKKNGVPIGFSGTTLASSIIYSSLTTLGTLSELTVDTSTSTTEGGGLISISGRILISGSGASSSINNVVIGNVTPQNGTFESLTINNTLSFSNSALLNLSPFIQGNIDNMRIGISNPADAKFTNITITLSPTNSSHATTKEYVDTANTALKINATALAIALGS